MAKGQEIKAAESYFMSKLEENGMADYFKSRLKNRKCGCGSNATVLVGNGYKCRPCATAYAKKYTDPKISDRESIKRWAKSS